jgi:hypothetical protein
MRIGYKRLRNTTKKIKNIKQKLESGDQKGHKDFFQDYALKGGKVYRVTSYGLRWVLPELAKFQVARKMHDDSGHSAKDKTFELVPKNVTLHKKIRPAMPVFVYKSGKPEETLHPIPKIPKPFRTVHIDHLGPFVKTKAGNTLLLVVVDAFTKAVKPNSL